MSVDARLSLASRRAQQWTRLQRAAEQQPQDVHRSYDARYAQPEITLERASAEAHAAAAMAREYARTP